MNFTSISDIGWRLEQQDRFLATDDRWIVCDGHGDKGDEYAELMVKLAANMRPDISAITSGLLNIHFSLSKPFPPGMGSGTTFSAVFKTEQGFLAVQLGDSRIFYRRDRIVYEINNHSVSNSDNPDLEKIEDYMIGSLNGSRYIAKDGRFLAMSRRIGDPHFGNLVDWQPDFYTFQADAIVVTSDGFSGSKKIIEEILDKKGIANDILSWERPSLYDNFTAIVVYDK